MFRFKEKNYQHSSQSPCPDAVKGPKSTAPAKWNDAGVTVSMTTAKHCLSQDGLSGRIARKKSLLTQKHKKDQLQFCKNHKDWIV